MRGSKTLIENASATIYKQEKVGIIGSNGCGKSSLFQALLGFIQTDLGNISVPNNITIAYVKQQINDLECKALDYVIKGDELVTKLQAQKQEAIANSNGNLIAEIEDKLGIAGAWDIKARAGALLLGLGFNIEDFDKPLQDFSGGWRMRLNLAQALIVKSDLLLLDEPTNHLDLDAILFLQNFLQEYKGTILCISHDRDFLDSFINVTIHIDNKTLNYYKGNYSDFERLRAIKLKESLAARKKEEAKIASMQAFIDRFRYKATKAKQAQSLIKAIDKIKLTAVTAVQSPFSFKFENPQHTPNIIVDAKNLCCGYENKQVLTDVNFLLLAKDRIGLLGQNGQGKSTFVKTLCSVIAPLSGSFMLGKDIKIGYFAQHELENLDAKADALTHFKRLDKEAKEKDLRSFLGSFNFSDDKALTAVEHLSGGEQARLALALIVYQKPNLLLLDEPTNHLDLQMREALTLALSQYDGALLLVSHDRFLLESITNKLYLVDNGHLSEFTGDLEDYKNYVIEKRRLHKENQKELKRQNKDTKEVKNSSFKTREQKLKDVAFQNSLKPYKAKINALEQQLAKLEEQIAILDEQMQNNAANMQELLIKRANLQKESELCEEQYFENLEIIETLTKEYKNC